MIATAAGFSRMVTALSYSMGRGGSGTWSFIVAEGMEVTATRFGGSHLHLSLSEFDGPSLRSVAVYPGVDGPFEVSNASGVILGETRGIEAAVSIALDYLFRPLAANAQHAHDSFAC